MNENLKIDDNDRNTLGAVTNDANQYIKNVRVNPITGALIVEAHVTSSNTMIGSTIPGGTAGSVLFLDVGGTLAQDNARFFYNPTAHELALGHNSPSATLDVVGTFQYVDGNQGDTFVLISDVNGNASWDDITQNVTFIDNLVNNNYFTTSIANNNNFITELTENPTFVNNITTIITTEGSLTVEDEGTPLANLATTLNFVGPGVTASGSGSTKTITIPGGTAGGTVTAISIASSNGFAGSSDGDPSTPTLTMETTESGVLRGDGTAISGIADPSADTLFGWDDTDGANTYIDIGSGLSYDHSTHTLSATGGSGTVPFTITQTAHGFAVGDIIRPTTDQWTKSKADTPTDAEAWAQVTVVPGVNSFTAVPLQGVRQMDAAIVALIAGYAGGTVLYVDGTTAGALTDTPPTAAGTVSKPVGYVEADAGGTPISFLTVNYRGQENQASPVSAASFNDVISGPSAASVQTIPHGLGQVPSKAKVIAMAGGTTAGANTPFSYAVYNGTTQSAASKSGIPNETQFTNSLRISLDATAGHTGLVGTMTWDATNLYITWVNAAGGGNNCSAYSLIIDIDA